MKKIIKLFFGVLTLVFLCSNFVFADGAIIPFNNNDISEAGQKAIIFYDQGKEDLILSNSFQSNATDFGWLVPVPQKPEVSQSSDKAFQELGMLTIPKDNALEQIENWNTRIRGGHFSNAMSQNLVPQASSKANISVLETKTVGVLDIVVISANDSRALLDWLNKNSFNLPKGSEVVLNDYIKNNWYFVAAKINPSAFPLFQLPVHTSEQQFRC